MIIKKYKLFENKIGLESDQEKLLDLAVDTGELDLVKFFVDKNFNIKNDHEILLSAAKNQDYEIFRYLLSKGADINELKKSYILKDTNIQKSLIDNGYEQFVHDTSGFNKELKNDPKYRDYVDKEENLDKFNL